MDFARKQMEKYGWTDGKGLGKYENGISEALKPKLKRSVSGIGHDAAADYTEHWWTQLYDKAAKNVEVEEKNGKTKKIKTKDKDEFEITNSVWQIKKKRKKNKDGPDQPYTDFFIKKAVLTNGGSKVEMTAGSESEEEPEKSKDVLKMTDEELFAACGGRTAHKGARHGLRATGKLARIAEQEKMLLVKPQYKGYSHAKNLTKDFSARDLQIVEDMSIHSDGDTKLRKMKKKKKRCLSQTNEATECVVSESIDGKTMETEFNDASKCSEDVKKRKRGKEADLSSKLGEPSSDSDKVATVKKSKKKKLKTCV